MSIRSARGLSKFGVEAAGPLRPLLRLSERAGASIVRARNGERKRDVERGGGRPSAPSAPRGGEGAGKPCVKETYGMAVRDGGMGTVL